MLYNVKAGIIGLEELGVQVATLIQAHVKDLKLIAASGRTQKELLYAKNELSLEYVYGDEKPLLENHDVDALIITSDIRYKANLAIQAIEAGKHILIFNPVAMNLDDARAVHKTAESHPSQTVMCISPMKSSKQLSELEAIVRSEKFGKLQYVHCDSSFLRGLQKNYSKESGSIYLDRLLDEIEFVQRLIAANPTKVSVERANAMRICKIYYDDNSMVQFVINKTHKPVTGKLLLYFEKARLSMDNSSNKNIIINHDDGRQELIDTNISSDFNFPEYLQLNIFTQSILGKVKNNLKLDTAVESMRIALAFEKSDVLEDEVNF